MDLVTDAILSEWTGHSIKLSENAMNALRNYNVGQQFIIVPIENLKPDNTFDFKTIESQEFLANAKTFGVSYESSI